ncbi:MAG: glycosyltransferase family 4 protein [Myxococcaceae bacterium]
MSRSKRFVLATSGVGEAFGGIGVVSAHVQRVLSKKGEVRLWKHPPRWLRALRASVFAAQAWAGALSCPSFVLYEHVDLARIHRWVPGLRQVPYGVFLHGVEVWRPQTPAHRAALTNATLLLANSHFTAKRAKEINPWLSQPQVAWLGVQVPALELAVRKPVALVVSRLDASEHAKNHFAVLEAWQLISKQVLDAELVIVGDGTGRAALQQRVEALNLSRVRFLGRISNDDRDAWYQKSRALLFPSSGEGFGLVAAEAAAHGMAVLGLRGTVLDELFPNGMTWVEQVTGQAVAEAALPLLQDAALAQARGLQLRARVRAEFTDERFEERVLNALSPWVD